MNLNAGLEKPRFQLLIEACNSEDAFYVALHQVFCVWDFDQIEVASIQGFPEPHVLVMAFRILGQLIRDNEQLAPAHKKWFAGFPSPLSHLMQTSEPYRNVMANVGIFLGKLAAEWVPLSADCSKRRYPPLVDELVNRMGLLSPILQGVVFTAARRTMGISDGEAGTRAETLFRRDQRDHQTLAARYNTNRPPSVHEVHERNNQLAAEYIALHNQVMQQRRASSSAYGVPLGQVSAPTPVVPSNAHLQQGAQVAATSPWQQHPQRQTSWNQSIPSPDPTGNWQFNNQQPQMSGRTTASSPNPSIMAGRPPSVGAQRIYANTPSPTLLQGLSMQSPVQQAFQFPPAVRSSSGQTQCSQMGPAYVGSNGTFPQSGVQQHVDPSTQLRSQAIMQQQQQQTAAQYQVHGQHNLASYQQAFAAQQGQWQANPLQNQQHQQAMVHQQQLHQIQQQQHVLSQQVLNMNRNAQLRQSSNGAIELQQRAHSRTNSVGSGGRRTPGVNPMGPSPRPHPASIPGPRRPQPVFVDQIQNDIQAYHQINALQRPLVPPLGYIHSQQAQAINPDLTALHQAHIRSPLLVPVDAPPANSNKEDPAFRYYQAVRGFALEPTKIPTNTPLSKFEFRVSTAEFQFMAKDGPHSSSHLVMRQFRRGTLQYRLRCVQMKKSEAMCLMPDWVVADTVWPESACLEINKNHLEIRRKNHHGKDLPIDITAFIRASGPNSPNRISLSIIRGRTKMKDFAYFLAVETVEVLQHGQILDMCRHHRVPANHTLDKIKKSLAASQNDDEIAMVSSDISIDLSDPFTARIFETPVRGSSCLHRECFDLETFLITRNSKPKRPQQPSMVDTWKCPLCGRDARPYSLQVDDFLASVRARLAEQDNLDVKAIWIDADGKWRPKEIPRSSVKRSHPDDSDDSSDDEGARKQRALSAANQTKSVQKVVEVIDLDDD